MPWNQTPAYYPHLRNRKITTELLAEGPLEVPSLIKLGNCYEKQKKTTEDTEDTENTEKKQYDYVFINNLLSATYFKLLGRTLRTQRKK